MFRLLFHLQVPLSSLSLVDATGVTRVMTGKYSIYVGGTGPAPLGKYVDPKTPVPLQATLTVE